MLSEPVSFLVGEQRFALEEQLASNDERRRPMKTPFHANVWTVWGYFTFKRFLYFFVSRVQLDRANQESAGFESESDGGHSHYKSTGLSEQDQHSCSARFNGPTS